MTLSITARAPAQPLVRMARPRITLAMILCGIVTATGMAAASAATFEDEAPAVAVKYDRASLSTDAGARALYRRIVAAAALVCPVRAGEVMVTGVVRQCRAQAVSRAVLDINDQRLAAVHYAASRTG